MSLEVLRGAGEDVVGFSVGGTGRRGTAPRPRGCRSSWHAARLDPALGELNRRGALNGHVPVTAIVSLVAVAQALVAGAGRGRALERAVGGRRELRAHGLPVNHQYSKGLAAERRLRAALAGATGPS